MNPIGNSTQNNQKAKEDYEAIKDSEPLAFLREKHVTTKERDDEQVYG